MGLGYVKKLLKEIEKDGIKKAPETNNLKEETILDKFNNIKNILVDDEGNIVDKDDIIYEKETYTDEKGNDKIKNVPKIKEESLLKMQEKEKNDEEQFHDKPPKRMVVKEIEEIDKFGNVKKLLKEIEKDGIKQVPETNNLKEETILDKFNNMKNILVDDEGNIVDKDDIIYEKETYTDEKGNDKIKNVPKIKEESLLKMQEKEKNDEEQFHDKTPKRMIVKEIEEIDKLGNVKKLLKEIEKDGIKKVPETNNLKEETILDKFNNIKKVLVDDEGNIVDKDDIIYEEETYTDEKGNDKIKN